MSKTGSFNDEAFVALINVIFNVFLRNSRKALDESNLIFDCSIQFKFLSSTFDIIVLRVNVDLLVLDFSYWLSVDASESISS